MSSLEQLLAVENDPHILPQNRIRECIRRVFNQPMTALQVFSLIDCPQSRPLIGGMILFNPFVKVDGTVVYLQSFLSKRMTVNLWIKLWRLGLESEKSRFVSKWLMNELEILLSVVKTEQEKDRLANVYLEGIPTRKDMNHGEYMYQWQSGVLNYHLKRDKKDFLQTILLHYYRSGRQLSTTINGQTSIGKRSMVTCLVFDFFLLELLRTSFDSFGSLDLYVIMTMYFIKRTKNEHIPMDICQLIWGHHDDRLRKCLIKYAFDFDTLKKKFPIPTVPYQALLNTLPAYTFDVSWEQIQLLQVHCPTVTYPVALVKSYPGLLTGNVMIVPPISASLPMVLDSLSTPDGRMYTLMYALPLLTAIMVPRLGTRSAIRVLPSDLVRRLMGFLSPY